MPLTKLFVFFRLCFVFSNYSENKISALVHFGAIEPFILPTMKE